MKKLYYQINLTGTKVLKVYGSYRDVKDAFGENKASNISKLANDKNISYYSIENTLWTAIPENVVEIMGLAKSKERAIEKIQLNCVKNMALQLHKVIRYIGDPAEAKEIKPYMMSFLKSTGLEL